MVKPASDYGGNGIQQRFLFIPLLRFTPSLVKAAWATVYRTPPDLWPSRNKAADPDLGLGHSIPATTERGR